LSYYGKISYLKQIKEFYKYCIELTQYYLRKIMNFTLPSYIYRVKEVLRVIDGDTVDILIDVGFYTSIRKRIRMLDIDTDELRGGTVDTKTRAKLAKTRLEKLLATGDVYIQTRMDATGKYGRLLGNFYTVNGETVIDVNGTLVEEGYEKGNTGTTFIEKLKSFLLTGRL